MVNRGLVESILSFNIVTWHGNSTVKNKARLSRIVNLASKLICRDQRQLSSLYSVAHKRKAPIIFSDSDHPLNSAFEKLPSGRRIEVPLAKKNQVQEVYYPVFYCGFKW